jgi:hypothetical protein
VRAYVQHLAVSAVLVGFGLGVASNSALAEGGESIATAPVVQYGQQEFGSLVHGPEESFGHCIPVYGAWWVLPVVAGDALTIDWEGQYREDFIDLFAIGTTDFNLTPGAVVVSLQLGANSKGEANYRVPRTGNLPVEFVGYNDFMCDIVPGPYAFTAYVKHTVRLALARRATLPRVGTLPVAVHNPDGGPVNDPGLQVSVQLRSRGGWVTVGSAPVVNSVAAVPLAVPARFRRQYVSVRAIAQGSAYRVATSAVIRVRVV